ncbi:dihydrofolate reductase [Zeaxanthinibacter enoshimensis]|uniref:Dihydrofolate reductase n=2 Tax=Zeaxanthinibacter enoshimensis TaxID=392009 RepID=A0A4R6TJP1_9FLAO|nr:dihydrofolate reductase [Zeaxanthinibacter enoshimensis]
MGVYTMIAAVADNNAIGKDNDLLWRLPDDFKRFKALTTGHKIIMGRKTFESFPKPLPNRFHIVITRDREYKIEHPECQVVHSLEEALEVTASEPVTYIIGGGEIYKMGMPYADSLEITRVHGEFEADAFFPEIDPEDWTLQAEVFHPADDRHDYSFTYRTFTRKRS